MIGVEPCRPPIHTPTFALRLLCGTETAFRQVDARASRSPRPFACLSKKVNTSWGWCNPNLKCRWACTLICMLRVGLACTHLQRNHYRDQSSRQNYRWIPDVDCSPPADSSLRFKIYYIDCACEDAFVKLAKAKSVKKCSPGQRLQAPTSTPCVSRFIAPYRGRQLIVCGAPTSTAWWGNKFLFRRNRRKKLIYKVFSVSIFCKIFLVFFCDTANLCVTKVLISHRNASLGFMPRGDL